MFSPMMGLSLWGSVLGGGYRPAYVSDLTVAAALPSWIALTRASAAWYFNSAGALVSAAIDAHRFDYNPTTLVSKGLLVEEARTNVVLWNRDLTDVAWTPTNITAAKDQTGIDGVLNSASSITATAGNGTILQAITLASSARFQTVYVKRITGTGTVNMTMDNGTTWTAITVTASWTRVTIPTQTLANPTVGFQIVTSGDAIAVDGVQNENSTDRNAATSVILTTTAAVTRSADVVTATVPYTNSGSVGTMYAKYLPHGAAGTQAVLSFGNVTPIWDLNGGGQRILLDATAVLANFGAASATAFNKMVVAFAPSDYAGSWNGGAVGTSANATAVPASTTLRIGRNGNNGSNFSGWIAGVTVWPQRLPNALLRGISTL